MLATTLTCILHLLTLVTLLPMQLISIQAYPITSSPIEWTAENWAWQAWARQTSEEQSKGKARKVTPKSIFEIPYRNGCPPGHHSDGKRCIPTVSIDPTELLNQQVLAFVGDVNTDGNIEFEYEDDVGSAIATDGLGLGLGIETQFNIYDAPQKFSDEYPTNFDSVGVGGGGGDKLPSQDAPLKFNFFEQNMPTNENETMMFDNMPMEEEFDLSSKPAPDSVTAPTSTPAPAESNNSTVTTIDKPANETLINTSNNIVQNSTLIESNNTIINDLLSESSNISAVESAHDDRTYFLTNIDAISLPALVSKSSSNSLENKKQATLNKSHRISLYKGDSALEVIKDQAEKELAEMFVTDDLLPLGVMRDVTTSQLKSENDSTDYPSEGIINFQGETEELPVNQEKKEKIDHIRSVSESSLLPVNELELEAQELGFTTTLEPDETTSFQLDDTTIIEEANPPTYELQELLLESQTTEKQQVNVVEKLKVKPVQTTTPTQTTIIEIETSTLPPLNKTPQEQHQSEIINEGVHINVDGNRFDYQSDMAHLMDMLPISTTTTTTTNGNIETIMSALNQDTTTTRIVASETDAISYNNRNHMNKLNNNDNNEMLFTTTTILQHNGNDESVLHTKADVFVNHNNTTTTTTTTTDDDQGEIVFMVVNKEQTEAAITNNVIESLTTTTPYTTIMNKENNTIERTTASKRWSKVMPIFEMSTETTDETTSTILPLNDEQPATTVASMAILAPITEVVTTKSSSISISEKRKSSNRRNSKKIRLDKYPIAAKNLNILSEATKQPISTTTTTTTQLPLKITTEQIITTTTTEAGVENNNSYIDPFWWLPLDWHLDRHAEVEGRPLLLRLWTSVTSDREAKV